MKYLTPLFPFLVGWIVLVSTRSFTTAGWVNGAAQVLLFGLFVNLPIWRTRRMSYVDIGWPLGVAVIGVVTWSLAEGHWIRVAVVSAVYLFIGLRMGLAAIHLWRRGHLEKELPRYEYQKQRWARARKTNQPLAMQVEASVQGAANAGFLAYPAMVIASNPAPQISMLEILGLVLWVGAFAMETVADAQKVSFLRRAKHEGRRKPVCNVGLWRYSRHPNYFAEWMVWNALVIASIPSWLALRSSESLVIWLPLGLGLLFISRIMYVTLVYYTGAVPSEHYSRLKRPDYEEYQQRTNMFFPGPSKSASEELK